MPKAIGEANLYVSMETQNTMNLMNVPCIFNLGRASIEITRQCGNYSFHLVSDIKMENYFFRQKMLTKE